MTVTTHENHQRFANIINLLICGRANRLNGNILMAQDQEIRAEKALVGLCSDLQCTRWADDLLTAWEGSLAVNPLELDEWKALIYREGSGVTEDDLDQLICNTEKGWHADDE